MGTARSLCPLFRMMGKRSCGHRLRCSATLKWLPSQLSETPKLLTMLCSKYKQEFECRRVGANEMRLTPCRVLVGALQKHSVGCRCTETSFATMLRKDHVQKRR